MSISERVRVNAVCVCVPRPVPADGVKGKTWGPSTLHQRERSQIFTKVTDGGPKRWSKSAPNLEKRARDAGHLNIATLQEIGTQSIPF
jgi:mitogen-activated protein kinase kinase kinase 9